MKEEIITDDGRIFWVYRTRFFGRDIEPNDLPVVIEIH